MGEKGREREREIRRAFTTAGMRNNLLIVLYLLHKELELEPRILGCFCCSLSSSLLGPHR